MRFLIFGVLGAAPGGGGGFGGHLHFRRLLPGKRRRRLRLPFRFAHLSGPERPVGVAPLAPTVFSSFILICGLAHLAFYREATGGASVPGVAQEAAG